MGISLAWDDETHTILRYDYDGDWKWEDLYHAAEQARQWLDEVNHPVDVIIDMQNTSILPQNALSRGHSVTRLTPSNQRLTVVVGANALIRGLANLYKQLYPRQTMKFTFAASMDEARAIIATMKQDSLSE